MLETTYLVKLATIAGAILAGGFFGVVLLKVVTGEISFTHLLYTKDAAGRWTYSPNRLQLLILTVGVAANYLHSVMVNPRVNSLPDLPMSVIAALGASHVSYLGGKAFSAIIGPFLKNLR